MTGWQIPPGFARRECNWRSASPVWSSRGPKGITSALLERTPSFLEFNIKADYALPISGDLDLHLFAGMQNILNSYQDDFDRGPDRDAGYVYGPARPRTVFVGLKVHLE